LKDRPGQTLRALSRLLPLAALLWGCVADAPGGPSLLHPSPKGPSGYSRSGSRGVFENESLRLGVSQLRPGDRRSQELPAIIRKLLERDFVILDLEIENLSEDGARIIYEPVHTVLTDSAYDYRKPLDYTDLYDIVMSERDGGDGAAPGRLKGLAGRFYDLSVTIGPHDRRSGLLIFNPLSEGIDKAALTIKEIYTGTRTLEISFPFEARRAGPDTTTPTR